jgi:Zn finger protein HypA/HybF involved in hydrogenase expression
MGKTIRNYYENGVLVKIVVTESPDAPQFSCKSCGYVWETRKKSGTPCVCPKCRSRNITDYANNNQKIVKENTPIEEDNSKKEYKKDAIFECNDCGYLYGNCSLDTPCIRCKSKNITIYDDTKHYEKSREEKRNKRESEEKQKIYPKDRESIKLLKKAIKEHNERVEEHNNKIELSSKIFEKYKSKLKFEKKENFKLDPIYAYLYSTLSWDTLTEYDISYLRDRANYMKSSGANRLIGFHVFQEGKCIAHISIEPNPLGMKTPQMDLRIVYSNFPSSPFIEASKDKSFLKKFDSEKRRRIDSEKFCSKCGKNIQDEKGVVLHHTKTKENLESIKKIQQEITTKFFKGLLTFKESIKRINEIYPKVVEDYKSLKNTVLLCKRCHALEHHDIINKKKDNSLSKWV